MWTAAESPWTFYDVEFDGDRLDPERTTGPWSGHREFVYDLLRWRQPGRVVELGTHFGVSLFAINQALRDAGSTSEVHAIDSWAGDEHAGFYGEEVFDLFKRNLAEVGYPNVTLHRMLFSEALPAFDDESIDLLHIDGLHTYEALQEDFETWLPKVAPNGLVLLHDIDPESGYGSAAYFARSVQPNFVTRAFSHNFGLGVVLPKGVDSWQPLLEEDWQRWRAVYGRGARARTSERMADDQARMIDARDQSIAAQTLLIDERDHYIEQLEWELTSRDSALAQAHRTLRSAQEELLRIRDRAEYLEWLDVSPKLQLKALSRSLPKGVAKRARAARRRVRTSSGVAAGAGAKEGELTGNLREAVHRHFDATWYAAQYGCAEDGALEDYLRQGMAAGRPVSGLHASRLEIRADQERGAARARAVQPAFVLHGRGSTRRGRFTDLLTAAAPALVTIDLWDTLVVRDRPADAAKTATARRMLALAPSLPALRTMDPFDLLAMRAGIEAEIARGSVHEEYLLDDVLARMLEVLGMADGPLRADWARRLRAYEVQDEARWTRPVPDTVEQLLANPEWVVLSDFYMRSDDLRVILESAIGRQVPNTIISSWDRAASKRSGTLFALVREERRCSPSAHCHIGDNEHADVRQQVAGGGLAIQVVIPSHYDPPGRFTRASIPGLLPDLMVGLGRLPGPVSAERAAGRASALLAVALVDRAISEARRQGLNLVHYVSREGLFLQRVHEALEPLLAVEGCPSVRSVHLEVSRRSTFGATVEEPIPLSLHRMWSMYGTQSLRGLFLSIGVAPELVRETVREHGLSLDEQIPNVAGDHRVRAMLDSTRVRTIVSDECASRRAELLAYLAAVTAVDQPWVLADIGWRGTIQDNLARATPVPSLTGVYFGLFPFLNPQPGNTRKIAVGFDGNRGDEFGFAEPPAALERPWTVHAPSAVGYEIGRAGARPKYETEPGAVSEGIEDYQAGVMDAVPVVAGWMTANGLTAECMSGLLHDLARRYWTEPSEAIAGIWFDSDHDDSFGALNETTFGKLRPDTRWLDGRFVDHFGRGSHESGWPPGYAAWRPVRALTVLMQMGDST
jgi:predicted O-methyltransferase YrrM/FMN phosphatase YigB (HAD superfamily)